MYFAIKHPKLKRIAASAWPTFYADENGNIEEEFDKYFNIAINDVFKVK